MSDNSVPIESARGGGTSTVPRDSSSSLPQHLLPSPEEGMSLGRAMTNQPWGGIGLPSSSSSDEAGEAAEDERVVATSDFETTVEQLGSILEMRLIDVVSDRRRRRRRPSLSEEDETRSVRSGTSSGSSSSRSRGGSADPDGPVSVVVLSSACRSELREYVRAIGAMYRDCRYHKFEHAAHVTASAHKLLDMMEERDPNDPEYADDFNADLDGDGCDTSGDSPFGNSENPNGVPTVHIDHPKLGEVVRRMSVSSRTQRGSMDTLATSTYSRRRSSMATTTTSAAPVEEVSPTGAMPLCYFEMPSGYTPCTAVSTPEPQVVMRSASDRPRTPRSSTYGIDSDPLAKFAVVYAALVHDVDHQGVPNRQLVAEADDLALLYNDKSVAEQHSLKVAFQTLMKPRFAALCHELIPTSSDQFKFRRLVIELVLCTDIASPERMQLTKSKWNEAFGELAPVGSLAPSSPAQGEDAVATVTASRPTVCPAQRKVRRRASVGVPGYAPSFYPAAGSSGYENWGSTMGTGGGFGGGGGLSSCNSSIAGSSLAGGGNSIGGECLGIKRALHLHGSTIEFYAAPGAHAGLGQDSNSTYGERNAADHHLEAQERLRASVVLETLMNAADVAHTLQSFDNFVKWNKRLYEELYAAYASGRVQNGEADPADDWYGNQLTFYDIYILPLAAKLKACGAFGRDGDEFLKNAAEIRRRWAEEGMGVTCRLVCEVHAEWEARLAAAEATEASAAGHAEGDLGACIAPELRA